MTPVQRVTVFCASSQKVAPSYFLSARVCGELLIKAGYKVYYGGGAVGLMGALAESVLANGGELIGIIPEFMMKMEWGNEKATELITVSDLFERKRLLILNADVILVMPGCCGTVDELFEAITAKQLGQITAPIIILNQEGYYDALLCQLDRMIEEQFMAEQHRKMWTVISSPEQLTEAIQNAETWHPSAIHKAQL